MKLNFNKIFALILLSFSFYACQEKKALKAENGVLELKEWDFNNENVLNLNGEWEFYWNQLLNPSDFKDITSTDYLYLPGVWNNHQFENQELPGEGFATFRLKINGSIKNNSYGLRIPFHFSAYKLWINEELLAKNGVVGTSKESMTPQTLPKYIYFDSTEDYINITLQISNYYYDKGGAPASYKFGTQAQIKQTENRQIAFDLFLTGSLFMMALYHLTLFFLRKKEFSTLYFSLVCFLVMLRTIGLGETFLIALFPDFNFEIYIKLIFLGLYLGPPFFLLFIQSLYPEDAKPILGKIYLGIGFAFSLVLIFPASISSKTLIPYEIILATLLIYLLYILIRAIIKKRNGALIAFIGFFALSVLSFNDILFDNQVINTGYYAPYGLLVFIFSQSFLLSLKSSSAFTSVENLSINIQKINDANSRFVPNEFLSHLGKESVLDVQLGDHVTKEMSIFFADIRSFTSISEKMTPEENFNFINSLLNRISPIVRDHQGFIDKFIGDSIMALFPHQPKDALLTAGKVLAELEKFNITRIQDNLAPIRLGIGINAGSLMLGTIGEERRMDGTVISDAVNLASRLEGLTKVYGANLIISEYVLLQVKDEISVDYRFLGEVQVKGKQEFVSIYDVFTFDSKNEKELKSRIKVDFEKAVKYFQEQSISKAKALFENISTIYPEDKATSYYLSKIEEIHK